MTARRAAFAASAAALLAACNGAGVPLLHGAHTLPDGQTTFGAGVSAQLLSGGASRDLDAARAVSTPVGESTAVSPSQRATYVTGAAAVSAMGPGASPWLAARLGLPASSEAGLGWAGRTVRADVRHAFALSQAVDLSVGLGGSALVGQRDKGSNDELAGLNTAGLRGAGVDVPILVGWRSTAEVVTLWGGVRGGLDRLGGTVQMTIDGGSLPPTTTTDAPPDVPVSGTHLSAGGVVGFSIGFRRLRGAFELTTAWHRFDGAISGTDVKTSGVVVAPSAALITRF